MFQVLDSYLILLDLQDRILQTLQGRDRLLERATTLAEGARHLEVSILLTEQIPEKLGATIAPFPALASSVFSKHHFSAAHATGLVTALQANGCRSVILAGIETHICIQQSALDLASLGFRVGVVADATTAGTALDHDWGLRRMMSRGIEILTVESILMEWTHSSQHPAFRAISQLIKAQRAREKASDNALPGTSP